MSSLILPAHARAPIRDALADLGQTAEVGRIAGVGQMVNFEVGVGGYYRIWKKRPGQPRKLVRDWFKNLVLDAGLDRVLTNSSFNTHCYIGSGNTLPSVGNTNMESLLGASSTSVSDAGRINESPYYAYWRKTFTFAAGVGTGNVAEVGIGWNSGPSGSLFSRALIVDVGGSPTTIAKLADEQLDVEYEFRVYPPLSDVTGTVSGYGYTLRAANLGVTGGTSGNWNINGGGGGGASAFRAYTGSVGAVTGVPSGTVYTTAPGNEAIQPYTNGTFYRDHRWTYSTSQANLSGGIGALSWVHGPAVMQIQFTPKIDKTSTRTVRFTSRLTLVRKSLPL